MLERSALSRRGPILEVPDLSQEKALRYLKDRKPSDEDVSRLYKPVGGRIVHLELAADDIKDRNKKYEGMGCSMLGRNSAGFSLLHTAVRKEMLREASAQIGLAEMA